MGAGKGEGEETCFIMSDLRTGSRTSKRGGRGEKKEIFRGSPKTTSFNRYILEHFCSNQKFGAHHLIALEWIPKISPDEVNP
jgi:hypothetical protein